MTDYGEQVAGAVSAVTVHDDFTFSWFGMRSKRPSRVVSNTLSEVARRTYLVEQLRQTLYTHFFGSGGAVKQVAKLPQRPRGNLVHELSRANCGTGSWQEGWRAVAVIGDQLVVSNGAVRVIAQRDHCRSHEDLAVGAEVLVRFPKELVKASPGYYTALGDANNPSGELVRVYCHATSASAVELTRRVTTVLNERRISFNFKVLSDATAFWRRDSAVLYICRRDWKQVGVVLRAIADNIDLGVGVPALTKQLMAGVAVAEDPPTDESFGLSRSRLLAEALIAASGSSSEGRLEEVKRHLERAGVLLSAPYLNEGSVDHYNLASTR